MLLKQVNLNSKGGTVTVDGVEKTVEINEDIPATFDDGSTTKTVDSVGTYTVAADEYSYICSRESFTGKAPAVTIVRERIRMELKLLQHTPTANSVNTYCETS